MKNIRFGQIIIPAMGILISVFPKLIIVPLEAMFGGSDHLSFGDLVALCLPVVCGFISLSLGLYFLLKKKFVTCAILLIFGFIQAILSLKSVITIEDV